MGRFGVVGSRVQSGPNLPLVVCGDRRVLAGPAVSVHLLEPAGASDSGFGVPSSDCHFRLMYT